jgi:8-oxo-dGTP pyrophosphatase MutT (NUDIX family)
MLIPYAPNPAWSHAGGVTYRCEASSPEILIVRARPEPHDWVLPKGHIEKGETAHECARREIREEAGVDAEPIEFIGEDSFTMGNGKQVNAAFFLMRFVSNVPADEVRETRWCAIADAMSLIKFEGARNMIRAAQRRLQA